jgi:hypothetical protein
MEHMRAQRIVIPGASVVERLAAEAMHAGDARAMTTITGKLTPEQRDKLDALVNEQARAMQSRLSWLRTPDERIRGKSLAALLDKLELLQDLGLSKLELPAELDARCRQMAREGERYTAQAFQQIGHTRRYAVLTTTMRVLEVSITDAALSMFRALVGRARKRVEAEAVAAAEKTSERLHRIANVLDAVVSAAKAGADIAAAVAEVAPLATVAADSVALRRSLRGGKLDYLDELGREHRIFRLLGPRLLDRIELRGGPATGPLLRASSILRELGGDGRRSLPADAPIGHIEPRWRKHVFRGSAIDRAYYELATYFALASALGCGEVWAPASRLHRAIEELITPLPPTAVAPAIASRSASAERYLAERSALLDAALRATADGIATRRPALFDGERLRFPKPPASGEDDPTRGLAARAYRLMPKVRVTDLLEEVDSWTSSATTSATSRRGCRPRNAERCWRRSSPRPRTWASPPWPMSAASRAGARSFACSPGTCARRRSDPRSRASPTPSMPSRWPRGSERAGAPTPTVKPIISADPERPAAASTPIMAAIRSSRSTPR